MFILKDIQQIIDDIYDDTIFFRVINYINDLSGEEFEGIFDNTVDYAVCDCVGDMNVISYDETEFDGQIEVSGEIEVEADITAYAYWDGEDVELESITIGLTVTFSVYFNKGVFEDFEILDIYM